jgi:DNA-binding protein YbaB
MNDMPSFEEFERLWQSRAHSNVTVKTDTVTVTVSPKYQLLNVTVHVKGLDDDQRTALQNDIVKAVNEAIQAAVLAAARALDGLTPAPEIDAIKAALKKEVDSSRC